MLQVDQGLDDICWKLGLPRVDHSCYEVRDIAELGGVVHVEYASRPILHVNTQGDRTEFMRPLIELCHYLCNEDVRHCILLIQEDERCAENLWRLNEGAKARMFEGVVRRLKHRLAVATETLAASFALLDNRDHITRSYFDDGKEQWTYEQGARYRIPIDLETLLPPAAGRLLAERLFIAEAAEPVVTAIPPSLVLGKFSHPFIDSVSAKERVLESLYSPIDEFVYYCGRLAIAEQEYFLRKK